MPRNEGWKTYSSQPIASALAGGMMPKVLLQAGHSATFPPQQGAGGGAPAEAEWTALAVVAIETELVKYGIHVQLLGSWMSNGVASAPPAAAGQTYDLAVFCHYDAAIYSGVGGGFIDRYRPEKYDRPATGQAPVEEAFMAMFENLYFPNIGIPNKSNRRNANTWDYYAYRNMAAKTPRVLIEFGVGAPGAGPDAGILWNRLAEVASLTASAVVESFILRGLLSPAVEPIPVPSQEDDLLPDPVPTREEALKQLQQFGYTLPEGFGISERAILAYRRGEWRGPAISDEYPFEQITGQHTTRRDFTAGVLEYNPASGIVSWVEVVKESRM